MLFCDWQNLLCPLLPSPPDPASSLLPPGQGLRTQGERESRPSSLPVTSLTTALRASGRRREERRVKKLRTAPAEADEFLLLYGHCLLQHSRAPPVATRKGVSGGEEAQTAATNQPRNYLWDDKQKAECMRKRLALCSFLHLTFSRRGWLGGRAGAQPSSNNQGQCF